MKNFILFLVLLIPFASFSQIEKETSKQESFLYHGELKRCSISTQREVLYTIEFNSVYNSGYKDSELIKRIENRSPLYYKDFLVSFIFGDTTNYRLISYEIFPPNYKFEIYEKVSEFNFETGNYDDPVLKKTQTVESGFVLLWIFWVLYIYFIFMYYKNKIDKYDFWDWYSKISTQILLLVCISLFIFSMTLTSFYESAIILVVVLIAFFIAISLLAIAIKAIIIVVKTIIWLPYIFKSPKRKILYLKSFPGKYLLSRRSRIKRQLKLIDKIKTVSDLDFVLSFLNDETRVEAARAKIRMKKESESESSA